MATIGKHGKIIFSEIDIQFIKDNFQTMTNKQITAALGLTRTIVKNKAYELGLQRMTPEKWPQEAVQFLKDNYHKIGDTEIVKIFTVKYPKQKGWTTSHIQKKLDQLGLHRNKLDWFQIKERNRLNGSYGKRNPKNNPKPPKIYFTLDAKTRIEVRPGQTIQELKIKYNVL